MAKTAPHKQGKGNNLLPVGIGIAVIAVAAGVLLYLGQDSASPEDSAKARAAALASEHAPSVGNADAKVHIVEFLDPACETCAVFYPMVKQWMSEVPNDIRLSVRHVAFHEGAEHAVRVLEASRAQGKYWETLEALLASQQQWVQHHVVLPDRIPFAISGVGLDMDRLMADMNSTDVTQRMEQDRQDSITLKVSATPEYFVNGRPLPSFGQRQLAQLIREELEK